MAGTILGESVQMWAVFAIILGALVLFATERLPMEVTSIGVVCALLVFFSAFPVDTGDGHRLNAARILQGFANPALFTVLALLVMGEGMVRTGVLDRGARLILALGGRRAAFAVGMVLLAALAVSGFLNNIPVVVIFIPIMQVLAERFHTSVSKVMIPLSFAAVLGGMTTLVGSSTNLLVNSALIEVGQQPFGFFDFTIPGAILAGAGFLYVLLVAPRVLPDRASLVQSMLSGGGKQFIAQISVSGDSRLVGKTAPGGIFADLTDMTVRVVQRGEEAFLPPFEGIAIAPGDALVVAATRKALTEAMAKDSGLLDPDLSEGGAVVEDEEEDDERPRRKGGQMLAEVMIMPTSRMIGQSLSQISFHHKTHCIVLGIQRRSRMIRMRMTEIRLAAGDVLLIQGRAGNIDALKGNPDVMLIEWSAEELPVVEHAKRVSLIFVTVMGLAASGTLPIVAATMSGAVAMVATGVLNVRQATRAVDPKIVATIGAALAMGVSMQETGGATYLAQALLRLVGHEPPAVVLSAFFLLVAVMSNIITTKTCAVLFTPIAVGIANELGLSPVPFAVVVIFASNCSFASPLGYQTNLLVMGPGHNRFLDFTRVGLPLIVLLWAVFSLVVPWYYGF